MRRSFFLLFTKNKSNDQSIFGMKQGFTMVEIIITVALFGILAGIGVYSFYGHLDKVTLSYVANLIADEIQYAQHRMISGLPYDGDYDIAYGVQVTDSRYTLYADTNTNGIYESSDEVINTSSIRNIDDVTICLTNDVSNCGSAGSRVDITFKGEGYIADIRDPGQTTYRYTIIIFEKGNFSKRLIFEQNGSVQVKE